MCWTLGEESVSWCEVTFWILGEESVSWREVMFWILGKESGVRRGEVCLLA